MNNQQGSSVVELFPGNNTPFYKGPSEITRENVQFSYGTHY